MNGAAGTSDANMTLENPVPALFGIFVAPVRPAPLSRAFTPPSTMSLSSEEQD